MNPSLPSYFPYPKSPIRKYHPSTESGTKITNPQYLGEKALVTIITAAMFFFPHIWRDIQKRKGFKNTQERGRGEAKKRPRPIGKKKSY